MLEEYNFGDVYIRHAIDEHPDDRGFTMHLHERFEIYYYVSGDVEYLVEGTRYPFDGPSLMIMRPAESHKAKIISGSRYERYAINFPVSFVEHMDSEQRLLKAFTDRPLGKGNKFGAYDMDMNAVHRLFLEMYRDNETYDRGLAVKTHLQVLLYMIHQAFQEKEDSETKPKSTAERIVMYVNRHLVEELTIPELAKRFYMSPSQFGRVFKQATGAAPWDYIIKKRLTIAKEKLSAGESAGSVCESCGFGDYSSFYRAYTKHFGHAPKEESCAYAKKSQENHQKMTKKRG